MVSAHARAAFLPSSTPTTPLALSSVVPILAMCASEVGARGPMPLTNTWLPMVTRLYVPAGGGGAGSSSGGCSTTRRRISGVPSGLGGGYAAARGGG